MQDIDKYDSLSMFVEHSNIISLRTLDGYKLVNDKNDNTTITYRSTFYISIQRIAFSQHLGEYIT